jgi:hypothetical protein
MGLGGLRGMVGGMQRVRMRHLGMVGRRLGIAFAVMLGGFMVMLRSMLVVMRGLDMMFVGGLVRHYENPFFDGFISA